MADKKGKARIVTRIDAARSGNFGDRRLIGAGVSEMRIDFGPGYRVYYMREASIVYLLLCGGDKSTQKADILLALKMAKQLQAAKLALDQTPVMQERGDRRRPKAKRRKDDE